jgi:hypothetical protein
MKPILISTLLILGLLATESCNKRVDDTKSPKDKTSELLLGAAWNIKTVVADGTDQTTVFNGMTLSFNSTSYTTTNGGALWPSNGEWSYADESGKSLLRSDGLLVTIVDIADNSLSLGLVSTKGSIGGRVNSVSGNYVFTFEK